MRNTKLFKILVSVIAAGLLVFLITLRINPLNFFNHYGVTQTARTFLFSQISSAGSFFSKFRTIGRLIHENATLKEEKTKLLSQLASQMELDEQNKFLREALNLSYLSQYRLTDAKAFNLQFTPEGHYLLINVGSVAGINEGNVVITSSGVLIGQISDVYNSFSRVKLVTNPDFKATVRLLNRPTSGISRGSLGEGIFLDFISQGDEVVKGDTVITSGNDLFPGGLIVGTVEDVSPDDGNLFKQVLVKPEFKNINISLVLILGK